MNTQIDPKGRFCNHCDVFKPWSDYSRLARGLNGHTAVCKPCRAVIERSNRDNARLLSPEEVRALFDYNADTGELSWRIANRGLRRAVGNKSEGNYTRVRISGKYYGAHRLAWAWYYGKWPPHDVDHVNHDRSDNRIANLRLATRAENSQNIVRQQSRGVRQTPSGKFNATIHVNAKRLYLGTFNTLEEAVAARLDAELRLWTHRPV